MGKLTKNQKLAASKIEEGKVYTLKEAASLVKEITTTKFDASVDIDVRLGVDPRKANQMVRGVVSLPNGTGKVVRVLALCTPDQEAAAKEAGALLVHVSTDYVFGGDPYNTPCREDQKGTPTGVYGLTKLQGEQAIQASGCDYVIIRTAWLYSEFGKNFVKTMLNLTATKPQLNVVFDQTGTPTYALDLAEVIAAVIADYAAVDSEKYPKTGVYHYSNEGVCSWFDFTKMIAEYAGHTECNIQPCHSDEFPSPVKRPSYSVLDKTKIKETFGVRVPYWTDSLKVCLGNMRN